MMNPRDILASTNRFKNNEQHTKPEGTAPSAFFVLSNDSSLVMQLIPLKAGAFRSVGTGFVGTLVGTRPEKASKYGIFMPKPEICFNQEQKKNTADTRFSRICGILWK